VCLADLRNPLCWDVFEVFTAYRCEIKVIGRALRLHLISCIYSCTSRTGLRCLSRLSSLTHCSPPISSQPCGRREPQRRAEQAGSQKQSPFLGRAFGIPHRATPPSISDMTACFLTACQIASHSTLHSGRKLSRSRHANAAALSHHSHRQILSRAGRAIELPGYEVGV
jgi:hypothetical protein